MGRPASPTRVDPVLGTIRRCPSCREWWPDDAEFFVSHHYAAGGRMVKARGRAYTRRTSGVTKRCRACERESQHRSDANRGLRVRLTARRNMVGHCATVGCMVGVPAGRTVCSGCSHTTVGPLTVGRLRDWGLLPPKVRAA